MENAPVFYSNWLCVSRGLFPDSALWRQPAFQDIRFYNNQSDTHYYKNSEFLRKSKKGFRIFYKRLLAAAWFVFCGTPSFSLWRGRDFQRTTLWSSPELFLYSPADFVSTLARTCWSSSVVVAFSEQKTWGKQGTLLRRSFLRCIRTLEKMSLSSQQPIGAPWMKFVNGSAHDSFSRFSSMIRRIRSAMVMPSSLARRASQWSWGGVKATERRRVFIRVAYSTPCGGGQW